MRTRVLNQLSCRCERSDIDQEARAAQAGPRLAVLCKLCATLYGG
jgi:hypothetical protein